MRLIVPMIAIALLAGGAAACASGSGGAHRRAAAASVSGIRGRVTKSPTCPVETNPPQPGCAPRGFKARLRVFRLSDKHVVARFYTRDDGRFALRLRAGRYGVTAAPASGGSFPRCPGPVKTVVHSGAYSRVTIDCDTGIR